MAYLPFEGRVRGMSTCRVLMSNWYYHLQLIAPILFSVRHLFTHQPKLCETPRPPLRNSAVKQQNHTFFCETHGNQYFTTKGKTAKSLKKETHQRPSCLHRATTRDCPYSNDIAIPKTKTAKSLKKETHQRLKNQFIIYHLQLIAPILFSVRHHCHQKATGKAPIHTNPA